MRPDESTLAPLPTAPDADTPGPLALTVAWHPDPGRIGDSAHVPPGGLPVARGQPVFGGGPLADPHLSRSPTRLDPAPGDVIVLLDRIVLVAHPAHGTGRVGPDLGMVGLGDGIGRVREQVLQVADLAVPVLVRGETGTGKEHVAVAIHRASRRSGGPFVALDLGAIPPSTAAAELCVPAGLAAELVRARWPGNVRQLRSAVRPLVVASRGRAVARRTPALDRVLESAPAPPPRPPPAGDLDDDTRIAALRVHGFAPGAEPAELAAAREAVGDDPTALAAHLEVSRRALVLRRSELGG